MPDQPLTSPNFTFPPDALKQDIQIKLFPLQEDSFCQEVIKIVVSRQPLNFDFLPFPENDLYIGVRGGDINKLSSYLRKQKNWQEMNLKYKRQAETRGRARQERTRGTELV